MPTRQTLIRACTELAAVDRALARAYESIDAPVWRSKQPVYATIARSIVFQQISTRAAASIWERLNAQFAPLIPETVLAADEETLRGCGLSGPKMRYLRTVATAIIDGSLDLERVSAAPGPDARRELLAVTGIGPWTAELFMLYVVEDTDAFPTGDVGLMESYRRLDDADVRMDGRTFTAFAERWRPWRGVAAHLLWGWLNARRAEDSPGG